MRVSSLANPTGGSGAARYAGPVARAANGTVGRKSEGGPRSLFPSPVRGSDCGREAQAAEFNYRAGAAAHPDEWAGGSRLVVFWDS